MDKRRIVLLGATGFTGQRVLDELLARGELPTLVGRSRGRLLALAGGHVGAHYLDSAGEGSPSSDAARHG
jgi:uncharacterized protein YbjT (DUF2867 family)